MKKDFLDRFCQYYLLLYRNINEKAMLICGYMFGYRVTFPYPRLQNTECGCIVSIITSIHKNPEWLLPFRIFELVRDSKIKYNCPVDSCLPPVSTAATLLRICLRGRAVIAPTYPIVHSPRNANLPTDN